MTSRRTSTGFIDFLLLDENGFPFIVLEAKSEDKNPLVGKEQARTYARNQNCRFIILSNGNQHYFWDLDHGNPHPITAFPAPDSASDRREFSPNPQALIDERVGDDYIVLTQYPNYANQAAWKNENEREGFIRAKRRCPFCAPINCGLSTRCKERCEDGSDRFLFEMATGTGKTLTAAAVIKLFLQTQKRPSRPLPGGQAGA